MILDIRDLSIQFQRKNSCSSIVEKVSFKVDLGEVVSIVGPSGCGKTTLLNAIAGLIDWSGDIQKEDGGDASNIGYVFQQNRLLKWRTIAQNIMLPIENIGISKKELSSRVSNAMSLVGIEPLADCYPTECSTGEQVRAGIARAIIRKPKILLMDEPFSSLDELNARRLRKEVENFSIHKKTVILFVTHNVREAVFLSDRVIVLSELPAKIKGVVCIDTSRPRMQTGRILDGLEERVYDLLGVK